MAKKIVKMIKLQIPAGKANPAPPIGPALGGAGINIMAFCKEYNAKTQDQSGDILPVEITVYQDKSFTFGVESGSKVPNRDKVGKLTKEQVKKIANRKRPDMRVASDDAADRLVMGTARSMGVDIIE